MSPEDLRIGHGEGKGGKKEKKKLGWERGRGKGGEGADSCRSPELSALASREKLLEGREKRETEDPPSSGDSTLPLSSGLKHIW